MLTAIELEDESHLKNIKSCIERSAKAREVGDEETVYAEENDILSMFLAKVLVDEARECAE